MPFLSILQNNRNICPQGDLYKIVLRSFIYNGTTLSVLYLDKSVITVEYASLEFIELKMCTSMNINSCYLKYKKY